MPVASDRASAVATADGSVRPVSFDEAWVFLLKVGGAARRYGSTTARLQAFMRQLAQSFGYEGVFYSTPSTMVLGLRASAGQPQRVEVLSVPAAGLELNKLACLGDLVAEVTDGRTPLRSATLRLDDIDRLRPSWGAAALAAGYCLVGFGLAALLGGGWPDAWAAALLAAVVYGIVVVSSRLGGLAAEWLPLTSALVAAALATLAKLWVPELNLVLVTLAAVAVLLPGYSISLGVIELAAQHITCGAAQLVDGLICLAKQFIGAWLGVMLISSLFALAPGPAAAPVDGAWLWLLVPFINIGLCIVFQTSRRDFAWAFAACTVAYLGLLAGNALVGGNQGGVLLGTIVAVGFANLWARRTERPTSIVLLPAVILLVSGTIGFRGLASIAAGEVVAGEQQFLQMFVVALTIGAGLLVGNTLFRARSTL